LKSKSITICFLS